MEPSDKSLPVALEDLLGWRFPDALWIATEVHSKRCITTWILDLDYAYTEWIAHLSLDDRWTLSPVRGPWHTAETGHRSRKGNRKWRKKRRMPHRK